MRNIQTPPYVPLLRFIKTAGQRELNSSNHSQGYAKMKRKEAFDFELFDLFKKF